MADSGTIKETHQVSTSVPTIEMEELFEFIGHRPRPQGTDVI